MPEVIARPNIIEREWLGNPGEYELGVVAEHWNGIGSVLARCETTGEETLITREDTNPRTNIREWYATFTLPEGLHTIMFRVTATSGEERTITHQVCAGEPGDYGWTVIDGQGVNGNDGIYYLPSTYTLFRYCNIDLTTLKYFNNDNACMWFDNCGLRGRTYPANNQGAHVRPRVKNARAYATGCIYEGAFRPFSEHIIARNNVVHDAVSDVARNTLLVTGNRILSMDGFADGDHTDFVQIFRDHADVIIQDNTVRNVRGPVQLMFFDGYIPAGDQGVYRNFAIRRNILEGPELHPEVYSQTQFRLRCDNFVVRDNDFGQETRFRLDGGFQSNGFLLERNIFRRAVGINRDDTTLPADVTARGNVYCGEQYPAAGGSPLARFDLDGDGNVTGNDIQEYVNRWTTKDPSADMTTTGAGITSPNYGVPDGTVTGTDLQFYTNHWHRLNSNAGGAGGE